MRDIINGLSRGNSRLHNAGRFSVIKMGKSPQFYYYYIDIDDKLGKGAFGIVYKAYEIDDESYRVNRDKPFVLKEIQKDKFDHQEVEIAARYCKTVHHEIMGDFVNIITDFIPGQPLFEKDGTPLKKLEKLSFYQRIHLICQLLLQYNLLHHNTPSTDRPIIHADTKGDNLLVHIDENIEENEVNDDKLRITVIDFGLSVELQEDNYDDDTLVPTRIHPNPNFNPPEAACTSSVNIKSDIHMLTVVIRAILENNGDAWRERYEKYISGNNYSNSTIQVSFDKLIKFPTRLQSVDLRELTIKFLSRMQAEDYMERPSSDEALSFFMALKNLCIPFDQERDAYNTETSRRSRRFIYSAKLVLLSSDLWDTTIGNNGEGIDGRRKTFQHYDFNGNEFVCEAIVKLHYCNLLDYKIISALGQGNGYAERLAQAIIFLNRSTSQLNSRYINLLSQEDDYADELAQAIVSLGKLNLLNDTILEGIDSTNIRDFVINTISLSRKELRLSNPMDNHVTETNYSLLKVMSLLTINPTTLNELRSETVTQLLEMVEKNFWFLTLIFKENEVYTVLQKIQDMNTFFEDFKASYKAHCGFFHNRFSSMRQQVFSNNLLMSKEDIKNHAEESPSSRTADVLNQLKLQ